MEGTTPDLGRQADTANQRTGAKFAFRNDAGVFARHFVFFWGKKETQQKLSLAKFCYKFFFTIYGNYSILVM